MHSPTTDGSLRRERPGFRVEFRAQFRVLSIPWKLFASPNLTPWKYLVLKNMTTALYLNRLGRTEKVQDSRMPV